MHDLYRDKQIKVKWLDLNKLCQSLLYIISKDAELKEVYYFSALAKHLQLDDPEKTIRHKNYIECLKDSGIKIELGQFKKKYIYYSSPNVFIKLKRHEEKETDVALGAKLIELFVEDKCDTLCIITGDTDLKPAINTAKKLFPAKQVIFAFPYKRINNILKSISPLSFRIHHSHYLNNQFPVTYNLKNGSSIKKPIEW